MAGDHPGREHEAGVVADQPARHLDQAVLAGPARADDKDKAAFGRLGLSIRASPCYPGEVVEIIRSDPM
jgi:hypothetical protein